MAVSKASVELQKLMSKAQPLLQKMWYYARVELTPPRPTDIMEIKNGFQNLLVGFKRGTWKQCTVKEAAINSAITLEVLSWFFIGECIGKAHLIGYDV